MVRVLAPSLLALALALAGGCPDHGQEPDGDAGGPPWPCSQVGRACDPRDPCAIDPICGADRLCHPTALQSCDDGLPCTQDICRGQGLCEHRPLAERCALPVTLGGQSVLRCFAAGERRPDAPCLVCDPQLSPARWSAGSGGVCDDRDPCTKDDRCVAGSCLGTDYRHRCADDLGCTSERCDGKGGCLGQGLVSGWCLIGGTCYPDGTNDPSGACGTCDAARSQSRWTPITGGCLIDGACHAAGDVHPGGCASCDPARSETAWTVTGTSHCLIDDLCQKAGAKHAGGCGGCDPTQDGYGWTPQAGSCSIDGACYAKGDKHPDGCAACVPEASATAWTVTLAGQCLIDGACHVAGAKHPGGCAACEPATASTSWTVKTATACLIDNVCRALGDKDTSGCRACAPATSRHAWTPLAGHCLIDGACHVAGASHPGGCGACAPAQSSTAWTPTGTGCLIDLACRAAGAKHPGGCGSCDPIESTTGWTVTGTGCLVGATCRAQGAKEPGGCGRCDPQQSRTSWSGGPGCPVTSSWSRSFGGPASDHASGVAVDDSGNIYVTGDFHGAVDPGGATLSSAGGSDVFVVSFSPAGMHRWSRRLGGAGDDHGHGVALDLAGHVYVTGSFHGSADLGGATLSSSGGRDAFLVSFTAGGQHRWSRALGGPGADSGYGVAADGAGNVHVAGDFQGSAQLGNAALKSAGSSDVFLVSYTAEGSHRWSRALGGPGADHGAGVAVDGSGNVYLTGAFFGKASFGGGTLTSAGSSDVFLASLTAAGAQRWSKRFGGAGGDEGSGVAVDGGAGGDVYLTGHYHDAIDLGGGTLSASGVVDAFVVSLTSGGAHRWSRGFGGTSYDYGHGVAVDGGGNVLLVGYYAGSADLGGEPLSAGSGHELLVASLTRSGAHRWSRSYGSTTSVPGRTVAPGGAGDAVLVGGFHGSLDLGAGPLVAGGTDVFLLKLAP